MSSCWKSSSSKDFEVVQVQHSRLRRALLVLRGLWSDLVGDEGWLSLGWAEVVEETQWAGVPAGLVLTGTSGWGL